MDPLQPQFYISQRAAAVHNQCFVVSCCGCGLHAGYSLAGHSLFIHPEGHVLWEAGKSEEVSVKVLDLNIVRKIRENGTEHLMPLLKHLYYFNWQFPKSADIKDMPLYDAISLQNDEMKGCM
jgi:predicted amidohydrolase